MRGRAAVLAAIAALAISATRLAAEEPRVAQTFRIVLSQGAAIQAPREDGMVNADNWMGIPAWWLPLEAGAEWNIDIARRLSIGLSPEVSWRIRGGSYSDGTFAEIESQAEEAKFGLKRAEARLSVREWGLEAVFGKLRPQFGANYVAPLSLMNLRGRDDFEKGLWMGGASWTIGDLAFEAYCETDPAAIGAGDPVVIAASSALFGLHEAGILFRREFGNNLGAWYRGQIGEGLIPYAELMLRETGDFIDVEGLPSRGAGWNADALAGMGYSPALLNLSCYLEYRYRQAGYGEGDWEGMRGLPPPDQAAAVQAFPFLQSAVHSFGLHARNAIELGGFLSWSLSCVYLAPDGVFAEAAAEAILFDRLALGANASCAVALTDGAESARSEMGLWPYSFRFSLRASWKLNAKE